MSLDNFEFLGVTPVFQFFFRETKEMAQLMKEGQTDLPGQFFPVGIRPLEVGFIKGDAVRKKTLLINGTFLQAESLEKTEQVPVPLGFVLNEDLHGSKSPPQIGRQFLEHFLDDPGEKGIGHPSLLFQEVPYLGKQFLLPGGRRRRGCFLGFAV